MYAGFNIKINDKLTINHYGTGMSIYNGHKQLVKDGIGKFILNDGTINGTDMQNSWFPQIKVDVFISHSHNDSKKAITLAGWLKDTFGLNSFIDSTVWGSADALLKEIDDQYCKKPGDLTYDYQKRNFSTSHVHTMLSSALLMMIDQTECLFFLNTPESINTSSVINTTKSPWIYYELSASKFVRKRKPIRTKEIIRKGLFENAQDLTIKYDLDIDHLYDLDESELLFWKRLTTQNNENHPLDLLYGMKNLLLEY